MNRETTQADVRQFNQIIHLVIHQHIGAIKRNGMEIEDLTQDLWIKALHAANRWDPKRGVKLNTYVQTACRNEVRDRLRAAKRSRPVESLDNPIDGHGTTFLELLESSGPAVESVVEVRMLLEEAAARLEPTDKTLLAMMLEEYPQGFMAEMLGCTQPNVSVKLKNIREELNWLRLEITGETSGYLQEERKCS